MTNAEIFKRLEEIENILKELKGEDTTPAEPVTEPETETETYYGEMYTKIYQKRDNFYLKTMSKLCKGVMPVPDMRGTAEAINATMGIAHKK